MKTKGTISKRTISGNVYYYHQYLEDGKQVSETLTEQEAYRLAFSIYYKGEDLTGFYNHIFNTKVYHTESLRVLSKQCEGFKKRFCYDQINEFVDEKRNSGKVLVLYGLRRTGKTTLMLQKINDMSIKDFTKTVYIKCEKGNTIYDLFKDLDFLVKNGFCYFFIDEVTLLEDFIKISSTISDIYGFMGKVILSGTDSLGFLIASYHELYDRCKMVHTTYIPFSEFSTVLGINSIDKYIEYGGTMSLEGNDYNKTINHNDVTVNEYVDSSIIHNIIHSLKSVDNGKYFLNLYDLYEKGELENVINRIIEDTNHKFAISIIEQKFKSHDYGSLKQLLSLPRNYEKFKNILDGVDEQKLVNDLMNSLNIINKDKQTHKIDDVVLKELEEYLTRLDVIGTIKEITMPTYSEREKIIFTQPGLRYAQAKSLVMILLSDPKIKEYDSAIQEALKEKLLSDIKGRMIEEMVIYETSLYCEDTFKYYNGPFGEFDMVTINKNAYTADVYEIKYSLNVFEGQRTNLNNAELISSFEKKYYPIDKKLVLYKGDSVEIDGVSYLNIEQYLNNLRKIKEQ